MLEVMESIAELHNKTLEDILDAKEKKKIKRGGFSKKLYSSLVSLILYI